MDPHELTPDFEEMLRTALDRFQTTIWTAVPVIVDKWNYPDNGQNTVHLVVPIKSRRTKLDGTIEDVSLPILPDVPVHYPGGSGFTLTWPLKKGHEGVGIFSMRCLDGWWQLSGEQARPDYGKFADRMHDPSDCMFIPGLRSNPKVLPKISQISCQLRSDDGKSYIEMLDNGAGMNFITDGHFLKWIGTTGDLHVSGAIIAGYGGGDQVGLQTHTHAQPPDSDGDSEAETKAPTAGT